MVASFITVVQQVIILFVLISIGFGLTKKKLFSEKTIAELTTFILYLVTPCVIIESFNRPFDADMLNAFLLSFLAAIVVHVLSIVIAFLFIRDRDKNAQTIFRFGVVFSNCAFMALPLQQALLGSEAVFYGSSFIAVFNLFVWTHGYGIMKTDPENKGQKKSGQMIFSQLIKTLLNPGIASVFLGLFLFLTSTKLPFFIQKPIQYLAALNTPLPMIVIGFYVASVKDFSILKDKKMFLASFLRLIFIPLLSLALFYAAGIRGVLLSSLIISASTPVGATLVMFSIKFNKDAKKAGAFVAFTTLVSVLTMPIIIALVA
ncbi:MAG: AEC family transporter [Spirochaetota bacterium]|jgi:predicted permease|nr:AEC family transporter [Spirochaetota bacterium]NMA56700.1 AEC family transporter [Treponema sp.]